MGFENNGVLLIKGSSSKIKYAKHGVKAFFDSQERCKFDSVK